MWNLVIKTAMRQEFKLLQRACKENTLLHRSDLTTKARSAFEWKCYP